MARHRKPRECWVALQAGSLCDECLKYMHCERRFVNKRRHLWYASQERPNPSIEGTSNTRLRRLLAAPHVKR